MPFKILTFSTLIILLFLGSCSLETENLQQLQKPNIIYILADDLGYGDLSCYGQTHFQTPHIDQLAKNGILFTQHYSGSTVCAPSRSALLTGQHTGHTPVRGNKEILPEGQWPLPKTSVTVAELLKENGYVTGAFGKWGLGFPASEGDPVNQGFDVFYGYNCQRQGHHYFPYHMWSNNQKVILEGNVGSGIGTYGPAVIHEKALKFLEDNKDTSFFMFYPSVIPHAELFATEHYMEKYRGKFDPELNYIGVDEGKNFRNGSYGSQPESHAAFAAMISILDDQVGEIMEKLEELGIENNTLVIFTSDNGPHQEGGADPDYFDSNGKLKGYKRDLYEGGIRVPLIAQWPGKIKAASETNHISAFWDFLPTVCEIVGSPDPENSDGISYLPSLLGDEQKEHDYLYWEFHEKGGRVAIRKGDWKLVKYDFIANPDKNYELYNLSIDIGEMNNLASENPQLADELKSILINARTESDVFVFQ